MSDNKLQVTWRLPNIARWISRAYGDGKYMITETVDPFHVSPVEQNRDLPDFVNRERGTA